MVEYLPCNMEALSSNPSTEGARKRASQQVGSFLF
jgi:hypothetical protein